MPITAVPKMEEIVEVRSLFARERPITFDQFLDWFGPADDVELIDGLAQKRMAAQLDHERLSAFLFRLLGDFGEESQCGMVFGSRTAVRINQFRGRLPDLLFVRQENLDKLEQKGLRFAPDLVIEIVSPNDHLSDIMGLEIDYRNIGVPEIVFIDQRRRIVRALHKPTGSSSDESEYTDQTLGAGELLRFDCLRGVSLPIDWLFADPRPTVRVALAAWQSTPSND